MDNYFGYVGGNMLAFETSKSLVRLSQNMETFFKSFDPKLEREVFSLKFKILLCIQEKKQVSPTQLVDSLLLAKSNVAKFCRELENENKICPMPDENDKRGIYYSLTKGGEKYIYSCLANIEEVIVKKLNTQKIDALLQSVEKLNQILDNSKGELN